MTTCEECGFDYVDLSTGDAATVITADSSDIAQLITDPAVSIHRRPADGVWSPLEYACHMRDVLLVQRERMLLGLREECPEMVPMGRDERVEHDGYREQDATAVARQLADAAPMFTHLISRLTPSDRDRTVAYNYPERAERTLAWVAIHTAHEARHHLLDVRRQTGG